MLMVHPSANASDAHSALHSVPPLVHTSDSLSAAASPHMFSSRPPRLPRRHHRRRQCSRRPSCPLAQSLRDTRTRTPHHPLRESLSSCRSDASRHRTDEPSESASEMDSEPSSAHASVPQSVRTSVHASALPLDSSSAPPSGSSSPRTKCRCLLYSRSPPDTRTRTSLRHHTTPHRRSCCRQSRRLRIVCSSCRSHAGHRRTADRSACAWAHESASTSAPV